MKIIEAVYEDGVFKPVEPVDLPEHSRVKVEPETTGDDPSLDKLYEILDRRFDSGQTDVAERHDEHQP
jgi:predicted DNA-binding antitoxin AbrB/MazE fold protein